MAGAGGWSTSIKISYILQEGPCMLKPTALLATPMSFFAAIPPALSLSLFIASLSLCVVDGLRSRISPQSFFSEEILAFDANCRE